MSQGVFASGGQTLSEWDLGVFQDAFGLPQGMCVCGVCVWGGSVYVVCGGRVGVYMCGV